MKLFKHKKTLKVLLVLALALLILGLPAGYFGGKHILRQRAKRWRTQGIAAAQAGHPEQAVDLLANYLRRFPQDVEALTFYISCREQVELPNAQHFAETMGALKLLLGIDPDRLDDRRHLLELYVRFERRPEALDTANAILAKHPKDLRTLELKTDVLTRMGQDRDALEVAAAWALAAPNELKAHLARLTLRAALGHPGNALVADAQKLREANEGDPRFELLQGFAYAKAGDDAQAAQWLKTAANHPGLTDDFAQLLVAQFDAIGLSEDSLGVLQDLVKGGAGVELRHTLASRLWERGKWEAAVEMLDDKGLVEGTGDPTLVAFRVMALANLDKAAAAQACRAALAARKQQAAARAWTLILRRVVDAQGVDDKQLAAECREALALDPKNAYLDYYHGDARARLGEMDLAVAAWRRASANNPTWSVPATRLVEALLQQGRPDQAFWVASTAARRCPTNAGAVISLARAWAADLDAGGVGHADDLLKLVNDVQQQLPGEDQSLLVQIQLLAQKKSNDEAIRVARSALQRTPPPHEQVFINVAAISCRYSLGIEKDCFAASQRAHGLTASLAYAMAVQHFLGGSADEGLRTYDELARQGGKADELLWRLARARYLDVTGNKEARAAWIALGDAYPQDVSVQTAIVSARSVSGDWDVIPKAIERLHALTGEQGLKWRLAQASLMVEAPRKEADSIQASVDLNAIIKQYPGLTEPRILLARALVQMNRLDGAVEQLSAAAQMDPTSVPIALQLASLLQSRGDFERVRQELNRVTPMLRSAAERHQAAAVLAQAGDRDKAVQILQNNPATGAEGGEDLLLAVLYRQRNELNKTEEVVRKLLSKPDLSTVQFAASLYGSQGRRQEAEEALALLDGLKLQAGVKELAWGAYYGQVGDIESAVKSFRAATQAAPANPVTWRTLAIAQLVSGRAGEALATVAEGAKALPEDKGFASIAQSAALLTEAADAEEFKPLVVSFLRDPQEQTTIELIRIVIEGRHSCDMERTAARLQQFAERNPGSLPALIQLAQCQSAMGRTNEALLTAQRAMTAFPGAPEPAQMAAQLCAATGRWQEMQSAAQMWKKRATDVLGPDLAIAQAQLSLGQYEGAARQLQPYIEAARAKPEQHVVVLTTYCIALANQGGEAEAANLMFPLAAQSREWRVRCMEVAVGVTDAEGAAAWLARVESIIPPDAIIDQIVLAEAYEALGRRVNDPGLRAKAMALSRAIAANPKVNPVALLGAAAQAERQEELPAAEALYRRALALDPNLWVAQNNLAMLVLRRGGEPAEAAELAAAAAKLQPQSATIRDTLAQATARLGQPRTAAETMRAAIKLEPDSAKWRVRLAKYLLDGGDPAEAAKAIGAIDAARLDTRNLPPADQQELRSIRTRLGPAKPNENTPAPRKNDEQTLAPASSHSLAPRAEWAWTTPFAITDKPAMVASTGSGPRGGCREKRYLISPSRGPPASAAESLSLA